MGAGSAWVMANDSPALPEAALNETRVAELPARSAQARSMHTAPPARVETGWRLVALLPNPSASEPTR